MLSGSRLTLGIGVGWLKEEFEALNSPGFEVRGAVTDEWITIFKQLVSVAGQLGDPKAFRTSPDSPLEKNRWSPLEKGPAIRRRSRSCFGLLGQLRKRRWD